MVDFLEKTLSWLLQDIPVTARLLVTSPAAGFAAIATIALSIGPASALFGVVDTVLLRPLPYRDAHQLVTMWGTDKAPGDSLFQRSVTDRLRNSALVPSSFPERWRRMSKSFSRIAS
jgi:hypothetical protein